MASYGNNTFQYGADGIRYKKNNTVYTLDGSTILKETDGTKIITYYYGNNGVIGFCYNGADYFFEKNLQGDVIAIYNSNGVKQAEYVYDAWGKLLTMKDSSGNVISNNTSHIAYINPIRYRSYYYDVETGLYYLESRYYDPETGRFLNADSLSYLGEGSDLQNYNLYSYCENNPVMYCDPSGHWIETVFDLLSLGVSIVEVAINPLDPWNWAGLAGDAFDLIPFVTGVGESIKGIRVVAKGANLADGTLDTIRFAKAVDFTDEAMDTIRTLDRTGEFTKSSMSAGRRIHSGYKTFDVAGKEFRDFPGIRLDYFDKAGKAIFELKPYNRNSLRTGVNQLLRYKNKIGSNYTMILELY